MASVNPAQFQSIHPQTQIHSSHRSLMVESSRFAELVSRVDLKRWKYCLILSDVILVLSACILAYIVRYQLQWFRTVDPASEIAFVSYLPVALTLMLILLIAFGLSKVYPYRRGLSLFKEAYAIATATTASIVITITISLFFRPNLDSRLIFLYIAVLITLLLTASRLILSFILNYLRRYGVGVERILLVGAGDIGLMVMRNIVARPELGYQLIGFLDDNPTKGATDIGHFKALGPVANLQQTLDSYDVERVIICLPWQSHRTTQRLLRTCQQANVRSQVVPDLFQMTRNQMEVEQLNGIPLISVRDISIEGWNRVFKRTSDLVFIAVASLFALPIGLMIAGAIRLESPGPIFYSQTRVGKDGKRFRCYKFRSMIVGADQMRDQISSLNEATGPLFKMRDDPRLTRIGRFIRRYSLDELPQIYNVWRGDMSLVGPRPNRPGEVAQYQEWHKKRLSVSSGITGLAQVSGRSDLTFDEMVLLDLYYVENWSVPIDLNIILRSIPAVLWARGAY